MTQTLEQIARELKLSERLRNLRDHKGRAVLVIDLDLMQLAQQAEALEARSLTEEEIEALAQGRILATSSGQIACIDGGQESDVHGFADGLRYARVGAQPQAVSPSINPLKK